MDYIRIELFAIVFGSLTKFLSLIFIMLQWNGSLYITLIVQMLTSSGFDYGLGTIHILRQLIFGLFLNHPAQTYIQLPLRQRAAGNVYPCPAER